MESFTACPTSLTFQQKRNEFKVDLKYVKIVVIASITTTCEE